MTVRPPPARRPAPTLAALSAALSLGACATAALDPPTLKTASAFAGPTVSGAAEPAQDWWRAFNDPVLDDLEARAGAANLDLDAARARLVQARAAAGLARAALAPAGEADLSAARARGSLDGQTGSLLKHFPGYERTGSLFDATAGAVWEIDVFQGLSQTAKAAKADAAAAAESLAGARLLVQADVASAYLAFRTDQRRARLARRQVELLDTLMDLTRLRVDKGEAPGRDADTAGALLSAARAAEPGIAAAVAADLNRLKVLIGLPPETELPVLAGEVALPVAPDVAVGVPADLIRQRPDLRAAERRLTAADARVGAAVSDYYPKITLSALTGFEATTTGALFTGSAQETQGLVGLKWRLFDFGRVASEVDASRGRRAEALADYRNAVLKAAEDVENALEARRDRQLAARSLHQSEAALARARDAAKDAYAAGTANLLEVVDAERQLLQTEDQAALADGQGAQASVLLIRALGGGRRGERP